jgi:benzoyl-CoA reductase/2-hydroxyglutaryl-CoA dehydratase subunit BcrC/BadD/HgdB
MEWNVMHHDEQNTEPTGLTSEEILLEALASKQRVRANLIEVIQLQKTQGQSTSALEPLVEIEEVLELA